MMFSTRTLFTLAALFGGVFCVGCAGPCLPPGFARTPGPVYGTAPAPVYASPMAPASYPVGPVLPVTPVGPVTPSPGPSATQPDGNGISLSPTIRTSYYTPQTLYPPLANAAYSPTAGTSPAVRLASMGQTVDGRALPVAASPYAGARSLQAHKVACRPGSKAAALNRARVQTAALAPGTNPSPREDLVFHGGHTIKDLKYVNIYIGGDARWSASDRKNIDYALEAGMTDPHLNHVLMQYFNSQPVTADFLGSYLLNGYQPTSVSQGNVRQLMQLLYKQGAFSQLDLPNTVIHFFLPSGAILQDPSGGQAEYSNLAKSIPIEDEADSRDGLGGYHGSVHVDGKTLYYAIVVYSEMKSNGTHNGIPSFSEPWKSITATAYHELQEARTDPDVDDAITTGQERYLGWTSNQGEEVADYPVDIATPLSLVFQDVKLADGSDKVPVQLLYSNAVHGPEGPIARPYSGQPLPPANRHTQRPGSTPAPTPTPPPSSPHDLQWLNDEWSLIPDSVKLQILRLVEDAVHTPPLR